MSQSQRIVAAIYGLLVAYCGVWVPWHYDSGDRKYIVEGYALIWDGPPGGIGTPDVDSIASRV